MFSETRGMRVWSVHHAKLLDTMPLGKPGDHWGPQHVVVSPDGRFVAAAGGTPGRLRLWTIPELFLGRE